MNPTVYDAGVLIAADRNDRRVWAEHRLRLEAGLVPAVPATVVAQASRAPTQAGLRRLLRGCEVTPLTEADAHGIGALLGASRTRDIVDASVVALAIQRDADIVSDDASALARLLGAAGSKRSVLPIKP
jgi:hypothetical protein